MSNRIDGPRTSTTDEHRIIPYYATKVVVVDEGNQFKAVESLRDWSKWLIGINFAAATSCVVVLQGGVKGPPRPFLMFAIGAFTLSMLSSAVLVRALATLTEALPLRGEMDELRSIYGYSAGLGLTVRGLARLQLGLLILGVVFFLLWVALKPPPQEVLQSML